MASVLDPLEGLSFEECQLLVAKEMTKSRVQKNYRLLNFIHTKYNIEELHRGSPLSGLTQEVTQPSILTQEVGPRGPYFIVSIPSNFNKHLLMYSRKDLVKWASNLDPSRKYCVESSEASDSSYTEIYSPDDSHSQEVEKYNFKANHDILRKWMLTFNCVFKILHSSNGDIIRVELTTANSTTPIVLIC